MSAARPLGDLHEPHTGDPDAPVVVRFAAVGDVVPLTVLLNALAQRYGRPVHVRSSGDWTPVLLGHDPSVSELRLVTSRCSPDWLTPTRYHAGPERTGAERQADGPGPRAGARRLAFTRTAHELSR